MSLALALISGGIFVLAMKLREGRSTANIYQVAAFANVLYVEIYAFKGEVVPDLDETNTFYAQSNHLKKLILEAKADPSYVYSPWLIVESKYFDSEESSAKKSMMFLQLKIDDSYVQCDTGGKVTVSQSD